MNLLATIRQRKTPWARSVLGLFVVVWLNMALQPCAMAFGGSDNHGRSHCPPAQTEEISSHSANAVDESDPSVTPCKTSAAQCAFVDDFNYDGRVIEVKVKDEPSDEPLGMATPIPVVVLDDSLIAKPGIRDGSVFSGDPPLLNVLYCVYLI